MADRTVSIVYRISDDGTIRVLDQIEHKVRDVGTAAERSAAQAGSAFTKTQANIVTFNQAMQIAKTVADGVSQAIHAVVGNIQKLDHIGEIAKSVGLTATELSSLRLAAQQGGVSLETLGRAVAFFSKQLVAAQDPTSKQAQVFKKLGVDINQDTLPALVQFGKALDTIRDGAVKTDLARTFFGRGGLESLNVFNAKLGESIKLNQQLGVTVDEKTAAAMGVAADAIDSATVALSGMQEHIAAKFAPTVTVAAGYIEQFAIATQHIVDTDFVGWLTGVTSWARNLAGAFGPLATQVAGFAQVISLGAGIYSGSQKTPARQPITKAQYDDIFPQPAPVESDLERQLKQLLGGGGDATGGRSRRGPQDDIEKRVAESLNNEEQVRLALLDAQVSMRERAIKFGEEDLRLAQQSGATQQQQLAIAQQLDTLEQQRLVAARDRAQAELDGILQYGPVASAEAEKLKDEITAYTDELARGPGHVRALTEEFKKANAVVINLGQSLEDSLRRVIDGVLNSNGSFNLGNIFINTLRTQASTFAGAGVDALFNGGELKIEGLDKLTGAFTKVGDYFGRLFGAAPSSISNAPNLGEGIAGPPAPSAENGGASGGGSTGLAIGAAAATYGASVALDIALNAHDRVNALYRGTNLFRQTLDRSDIANAAGGGGIVGGIGRTIFSSVGDNALFKILDPISGILASTSLFQAPTLGTQRSIALEALLGRASLPQQQEYQYGGHRGVRAQFLNVGTNAQEAAFGAAGFGADQPGLQQPTLEELSRRGRNGATYAKDPLLVEGLVGDLARATAARPAVAALATDEALGFGVALTGNARGGRGVATQLTNNLLLLGVGADEARRQLLKAARTAGIDLVGGLESVNKAFLEHKLTQDQLNTSAAGLVHLFNDQLPKAIDVNKIVAERTNATGGINIAGVEAGIRGAVDAYNIRQQIADTRLQNLDPRLQGNEIKRRIADLDTQLADSTLTYQQREDLLQRRAQYGLQYVQYADQRYSGSARTRAEAYGYQVAEDTARQLEDLGKQTTDSTDATVDNTTATKEVTKSNKEVVSSLGDLTDAIRKGFNGKVKLDVTGLDGEDAAALEQTIRKIVKDVLTSPSFKASQREAVSG